MSTHRTVLVIAASDEPDRNYGHQLQRDGSFTYQVIAEQDGTQLLALSQSQRIDGILLELQSPGYGDFELLRQLRDCMGDHCPPIIVIDNGDAEVAVRAFKNGAVDYLVKDRMTPDELRLALRTAIENAELKQELRRSQEQFQTSVENMLDCFGIFSSLRDESGQIVDFRIDYLNRAACENNQMPREAQIGRGLCEVLPGHRESGLFDEYCRLVETGESLIKDSLIYEDRYGGQQYLARAFDIRATRLNDGFVASWRDITDRKRLDLELSQTASALQASQQHYRELAEAMPQIVWTADATGAVNYWNQRWYEYTGCSEAESLGLNGVSTVHPADRDRTLELWAQAIGSGQSFEIEYRIRRWDGVYHWFICRAIPSRATQGQVTGWIGTITNVDDLKRNEAQIQQNKQQFQQQLAEIEAIYQSAPVGLGVLDADLRFVRINQRLAEINGLSIEAHLGRTVRELLPEMAESAEPILRSILETGQPLLNIEIHGKTPAKPGLRRTWLESFLPLKDGDRAIGINIVCEEVTDRLQAEIVLRESEERFRTMADNAPVMIWVTDSTGYCTYLSKSWYEFTGQTEATGLGFGWLDAVHPEDSQFSREVFLNANGEREAFRMEYRLRRQDGTYRWAIDTASPWFGEDGAFKGYIGSVIDIHDRKQTEEALQRSEARYRMLFESMTEGFCVVEMLFDEHQTPIDYRFLEVNPVFEQQTGLSQAEGKTARQLLPNLESYWFESYGNVALTGEPVRFDLGSDAMNRWFEVSAFRVGQPEQRKVAILFKDVSERKQVERELRESEARFRTLADNISQFAWMADEQGWIFWYNQRWLDYTGTTLEQMQGWGWQQVHHPDHMQRVVSKFRDCIEGGESWEDTFPLRSRDGQYRWFLSRAIPIRDDQGRVLRWFGTNTDITELRQTETALRQTTERLDIALRSAPIALFAQDLDLRYTWIYNPTHNYSVDQVIGRRDEDLVAPDSAAHLTQLKQRVLETGNGLREEVRVTRGDRTGYYDLTIEPIRDSQSTILGITCAAVDITDRKRAEEDLRQSEDRFRMAIESARLGTWDWNLTTNQLTWDVGCKAMFGLPPEAESSIELFFAGLHPDDRDRLTQVVEVSLNPASGGNCDTEYRTIGIQDGKERWLKARGQAYFDAMGTPRRFIGTVMDITEQQAALRERKQAEDALRQSEERYRCLAELIPQLVWTANTAGTLMDVNQRWSEFTGLTLEQAQVTSWAEVVHPEDIPVLEQQWTGAVQEGTVYQAEGRMRRVDGSYRWHLHQAIPQKDDQGQIVKWFGTATDIEAQKQLEIERDRVLQQEQAAREAAENANRIKDEFLAVLSHELRSPLNPILGWARLLQSRKFDPAKTAEALATIERNARLQTQLIDDLLDVAKILRGKLSLNIAPVNLSFVIDAAIETVRTAAQAKNISVESTLLDVGQVSGDAARLQQVFWNLLSNAIKFTPEAGRVQVQLESVECLVLEPGANSHSPSPDPQLLQRYAQITVTDTGKGISPEFLPYIFESFRQEDASTTRKYGGLGLGLAIVRQLVEAHGGAISADSPGEGLGATFTVRLPLMKVAPGLYRPDSDSGQMPALTGIRVLAADDDPDTRELLMVLLNQYGAEVWTVDSATAMLSHLGTFQPDVLISDIGMPQIDGYALIQQIRSLPPEAGGQIPAIALTAYARDVDYQQAIASGYQQHVTKPLEPERLVRAVWSLVRNPEIRQ